MDSKRNIDYARGIIDYAMGILIGVVVFCAAVWVVCRILQAIGWG